MMDNCDNGCVNVGSLLEYLKYVYEYVEYDVWHTQPEHSKYICDGFKQAIKAIKEKYEDNEDDC